MPAAICIFEDQRAEDFFPLTLTRAVYDLRCGIHLLKEKLLRAYPGKAVYLGCRAHLAPLQREKNPGVAVNDTIESDCLFLNGRLLSVPQTVLDFDFEQETVFTHNGELVGAFLKGARARTVRLDKVPGPQEDVFYQVQKMEVEAELASYLWDLVNANADEIARDFRFLQAGGLQDGAISPHAVLLNADEIHVGSNSRVAPGAVLDAEDGPIFLGDNVTVMANAVIEGPACVADGSLIKIGAKIYEGTTIGEVCKVGGEVEESIIHSYSNKQHEGFLGHAYLGQWVNLGADTNNSDLKNNYGSVKVHVNGKLVDTGSPFVGLFMGDHSKTGINTMFNTGTSAGVMCNIFGAGYPPKYIPSFSWGGSEGFVTHELPKALDTARRVMRRRNVDMGAAEEALFERLFLEVATGG